MPKMLAPDISSWPADPPELIGSRSSVTSIRIGEDRPLVSANAVRSVVTSL